MPDKENEAESPLPPVASEERSPEEEVLASNPSVASMADLAEASVNDEP